MSLSRTAIIATLLLAPAAASAHQPVIVAGSVVRVADPHVSKAYYGELSGGTHTYELDLPGGQDAYLSILVPDIDGADTDVVAALYDLADMEEPIAILGGTLALWTPMREPFANDRYLDGGEFRQALPAGEYLVRVYSSDNEGKYVLAIGEDERFGLIETVRALMIVPRLKSEFFEKSPADFALSILGASYIAAMFALAGFAGFAYRAFATRRSPRSPAEARRNIGRKDRYVRVAIGATLILLAVFVSWDPITLFVGGFSLFEAAAGWCGLYRLIGKNTCPA